MTIDIAVCDHGAPFDEGCDNCVYDEKDAMLTRIRELEARLTRAEAAARLTIYALHEGGSKAQADADHALQAFLDEQKR